MANVFVLQSFYSVDLFNCKTSISFREMRKWLSMDEMRCDFRVEKGNRKRKSEKCKGSCFCRRIAELQSKYTLIPTAFKEHRFFLLLTFAYAFV